MRFFLPVYLNSISFLLIYRDGMDHWMDFILKEYLYFKGLQGRLEQTIESIVKNCTYLHCQWISFNFLCVSSREPSKIKKTLYRYKCWFFVSFKKGNKCLILFPEQRKRQAVIYGKLYIAFQLFSIITATPLWYCPNHVSSCLNISFVRER